MWDSDFNIVGAKNGSPNTVLKIMGLKAEDHDKMVGEDDSANEIVLQNTSAEIIEQRKLGVKKQRRYKVTSDFEEKNNLLWNFSLE